MKFSILTPAKFKAIKKIRDYIMINFTCDDEFLYDDVHVKDIEQKVVEECRSMGIQSKGTPRPQVVADVVVTFYPDKAEKTYN